MRTLLAASTAKTSSRASTATRAKPLSIPSLTSAPPWGTTSRLSPSVTFTTGPGSTRGRQLVTIGALTALGGCEPQLRVHMGAALNVGLTEEEIVEALLHSSVYAGFPRALNATFVAREVFASRRANA